MYDQFGHGYHTLSAKNLEKQKSLGKSFQMGSIVKFVSSGVLDMKMFDNQLTFSHQK